jgi:phosphoenolpyruvate carboxylase
MPRWSRTRRCATAIFGRIRDGWNATHDGLLTMTRQTRLLEKHPGLETSIRLRTALYRAAQPAPDRIAQAPPRRRGGSRIGEGILLSINAIATALRNSG